MLVYILERKRNWLQSERVANSHPLIMVANYFTPRILVRYTKYKLSPIQSWYSKRLIHSFALRDYQQEAIDSILEASESGVKRQAIEMATGSGKTVVFSHLIPLLKGKGTKTLVLEHTQELIAQSYDKITRINPNLRVGIEMAESRARLNDDVIVASVQSLATNKRFTKFNPDDFKTIIIDECHHAVAPTYQKILKHFKADTKNTNINVIGFTATLARADKQMLKAVFDKIVFQRSLATMIFNKELALFKASKLYFKRLNLSDVKMKGKDYDPKALYNAVLKAGVNEHLLLAYMELEKEYKSTLVFCINVEHCREVCVLLQKQGVDARYVISETSNSERKTIVENFKQGKFPVLCNVTVFTEGTDIPNIDSIILARPTKLKPLMIQMIGRGLRLHKEKSHCHVVDLVGIMDENLELKAILEGKQLQMKKAKDGTTSKIESRDQVNYFENDRISKTIECALQIYSKNIVELRSVDGLELFREYMLDVGVVREILSEADLPWVLLYDNSVWGVGGRYNTLFLIKKITCYGQTEYQLTYNKFIKEDFSTYQELEFIGKSNNVLELLRELAERFPEDVRHVASYRDFERPCEYSQVSFIMTHLAGRIAESSLKYGLDDEQLRGNVNDAVHAMPLVTGYRFKLALMYSLNCDYSSWKANQILAESIKNYYKIDTYKL